MAKTIILVKGEDIPKNTILNGNVDVDKIVVAAKAAQNLYVKPILGAELYNKICQDFKTNTLAGDYLDLYDDYIKEMVIHGAGEIYLSQGAYSVDNGGIYKHKPEEAETLSKNEVDFLVQASRRLYEMYERELVKFLKDNSSLFPEYNSGNCGNSNSRINVGGWSLKRRGCNGCE